MKSIRSIAVSLFYVLSLAEALSAGTGLAKARAPSPIITGLAKGMALLKPVFVAEAKLQASLLGSKVDLESVSKEIATEVKSKPVVIYTYGLSPFSSEAIALLDSTGVDYKKIEVGAEWFLLDGKDSVKRVLLSEFVDNGATSLPKVFVKGQCIGGCAELADSLTSGKFDEMVKVPKKKSFFSI